MQRSITPTLGSVNKNILPAVKRVKFNLNHDDNDELSNPHVIDTSNINAPSLSLNNPPCQIEEHEFQLDKEIGSGGFATVYLGTWNNTKVAIKEIENKANSKNEEKDIMVLLSSDPFLHPNIIRLFAFAQTEYFLYLIMEYISKGSLADYVDDKQIAPWDKKILYRLMFETASAMGYLHGKRLLHRDIKGNNILLEEINTELHAKLCDFGLTIPIEKARGESVGSPYWMPPETASAKPETEKSDIFRFGMTLYEVFEKQLPFNDSLPLRAIFLILQGKRPEISFTCPSKIRELIEWCWEQHPDDRPTTQALLALLKTDIDTLFIRPAKKSSVVQLPQPSKPLSLAPDTIIEDKKDDIDPSLVLESKAKAIISQLRSDLQSTQTSWLKEKEELEEMIDENLSNYEKLPFILNTMIKLFCLKCLKYDNRITFFAPKLDPIAFLNKKTHQHKLARGVGLSLKNLLENKKNAAFLEQQYQINIEKQINLVFLILKNKKNTTNDIKINIRNLR